MKYLKVSELQANKVYVCRLSGNKMLVTRTYVEPAKRLPSGDMVGPWDCVDAMMWDARQGKYLHASAMSQMPQYEFVPRDYQFSEEG